MTKPLTPVSTFTEPVNVPEGGDARTAASVETPFQALTNRTEILKDILENGFEIRSMVTILKSGGASLQTLTGTQTDLTDITTTTPVLAVSDWVLVFAHLGQFSPATGSTDDTITSQFRIMLSSASVPVRQMLGAFASHSHKIPSVGPADGHATLIGAEQTAFAEAVTVKVQGAEINGSGTAADVSVAEWITFTVVTVRPTGAIP